MSDPALSPASEEQPRLGIAAEQISRIDQHDSESDWARLTRSGRPFILTGRTSHWKAME